MQSHTTIPQTSKEDIIQQQILRAAKTLFQTYGLQKVTMDDVAKAIGKGRSSIYYYYKSKDEIFDAVMRIEISEMLGQLEKAVGRGKDTKEKMHAFFSAKLGFLRDTRDFFKMLDLGMDADTFSQFNQTKVVHHQLIMQYEGDLLRKILTAGIKAKELRPLRKEALNNTIFVLLSTLHGLKRELVMANSFNNFEPLVSSFIEMVMNGIRE